MDAPIKTSVIRLFEDKSGNYTPGNSLFNYSRQYLIPAYQRDYTWDETQITDFIQSVKLCCEQPGQDVFMGTVQFSEWQNNQQLFLNIVDGQQRITTFFLFFYLIDVMYGTHYCKDNNIHLQFEDRISAETSINDLPQKGSEIKDFDDNKKHNFSSIYNRNLSQLKTLLKTELDCNSKDAATDICNQICAHIYFVELTSNGLSLSQIVTIFNTINHTGMDLNCADLFKVQYYDYLQKKGSISDFSRIHKLYEDVKESGWEMESFLNIYKHCIGSEHIGKPGSPINKDFLFKGNEAFYEIILDSNLSPLNGNDEILYLAKFEHLINTTLKFKEMLDTSNPQLISELIAPIDYFGLDLIESTRYWRYWTVPFVYAFFHCNDSGSKDEIVYRDALHIATAVSKVLTVASVNYGRVINEIQNYMCNSLLPLLSSPTETAETICQKVHAYVFTARNTQEFFKESIEYNLYDKYTRARIICTLSDLLDEIAYPDSKNPSAGTLNDIHKILFDGAKNKFDLEHIYPRHDYSQNPNPDPLYNGIGNMVVLESNINRSVKDKKIEEKIKHYKKSKFHSIKKLINEIGDPPQWDISKIGKRKEELTSVIIDFLNS